MNSHIYILRYITDRFRYIHLPRSDSVDPFYFTSPVSASLHPHILLPTFSYPSLELFKKEIRSSWSILYKYRFQTS